MLRYFIQKKLFNFFCLFYVFKMFLYSKKTAKALEKYQNKQLRKLIKLAFKIPFYQKKYSLLGIKLTDIKTQNDLTKLPILTKAEYRDWMAEEAKKDIAIKNFKFTHTSGSTGIPTTNIFPPNEYAHHYMLDFFCWIKGGYNPFKGKTLTRQPGDNSVGAKSLIQKIGFLRRDIFSMQWERDKIIKKINKYKPDFILANSSELIYIAQWIIDNKINIHKPLFYCPNGENIDGLAEKTLKTVYGPGLINAYGCTEMASFAVKKPGNTVYEIIQDAVITMIHTPSNEIKSIGTGNLLITPLYRQKYPLINYDIGDGVNLEFNQNGLKQISKINGRKNDTFIWPSGKQTIYKNLENINMNLENIFQIRFIQESYTKIKIQVVKDVNSIKTNEELENYLTDLYKDQFDTDTEIIFDWLPVISPEKNGKIRNMISKI